jgi:hypothetical protein
MKHYWNIGHCLIQPACEEDSTVNNRSIVGPAFDPDLIWISEPVGPKYLLDCGNGLGLGDYRTCCLTTGEDWMSMAISKGWENKTLSKIHLFIKGTRGADQSIFGKKFWLKCLGGRVIKICPSELGSQA